MCVNVNYEHFESMNIFCLVEQMSKDREPCILFFINISSQNQSIFMCEIHQEIPSGMQWDFHTQELKLQE